MATSSDDRVAVTGVGVICANGNDRHEFWARCARGDSGLSLISIIEGHEVVAGAITGFDAAEHFERAELVDLDRAARVSIVAAREALAEAGPFDVERSRVGIVVGQSQGWQEPDWDGVSPSGTPTLQRACDAVARDADLRGVRLVVSTACSAGANAIGLAADQIRLGRADVMIGGGVDVLHPASFLGFGSLQSLAAEPCSPYGRSIGLNLGEGAAYLVLERWSMAVERGARILAEVLGYGLSADAHHPTAPDPSGRGALAAMRRALAASGLSPDDVDYVNGHGTGTPANDRMERQAFLSLFGDRAAAVPVSSTKSMIGHTLGAAGAVEASLCVLAIEHQVVPPTINLGPGADHDFDFVPDVGRAAPVDVVVTNNYAFGGNNCSLVLASPQRERGSRPQPPADEIVIVGSGAITAAGVGAPNLFDALVEGKSLLQPDRMSPHPDVRFVAPAPDVSCENVTSPQVWRRLDQLSRRCAASARLAWDDSGLARAAVAPDRIALIYGTAAGPLALASLFDGPDASAAGAKHALVFPNTTLNAAAGHVSRILGLRGPTSTITSGGISGLAALLYAADLLRAGEADVALVVSAEDVSSRLLDKLAVTGILATGPARPFDTRADGLALGGAAITIVLETADHRARRGGAGRARLLDGMMTGDTRSLDGFDPSGDDFAGCMTEALRRSAAAPSTIDLCVASAAGIPDADQAEVAAITATVPHALVTAPKAIIGDCGAAAGSIGVLTALLAMERGVVPATPHLDRPIADLEFTRSLAVPRTVSRAVVNAGQPGASYASVVLEAPT